MDFDIDLIKRKILVKYPFFGSVIVNVDYKINNDVKFAGTDGKVIYYNPKKLDNLNMEEQIFIITHEICHIAFNHILRSEGKVQKIWNIATDAVINSFLKKDGLKLVKGSIDIIDALNYDAEQLYEKLLKLTQQNMQNDFQKNNKMQPESNLNDLYKKQSKNFQLNNAKLIDEKVLLQDSYFEHSMWKDAINEKKMFDKTINEDGKDELKKVQKKIEVLGEKKTFEKNEKRKKQILEELKNELLDQTIAIDFSNERNINDLVEIGSKKELIDWRYILKETIKYDVDWSYKNATIENGVVIANLEEQPIPETEIVLDTSGSIDEILLKNFLKECKNILKYSKLKVGCFDTKFYGFKEIRNENDIENMKLIGGGGTDFDVAVNAFTRRVENKIVFTDGDALMPMKSIDAIWIVFGELNIEPKGGKVIRISDEQFNRLLNYEQDDCKKKKIL